MQKPCFILLSILCLAACTDPAIENSALSFSVTSPRNLTEPTTDKASESILQSYADAWRGSQEFSLKQPTVFGFWIDGAAYSIALSNSGASLSVGEPSDFDWGFETDLETLIELDSGRLNALTAMGQARADDPIPLQPKLPDDFSDQSIIRGYYIPLMLHFWNREWPESVPFGDGATRLVHGANTSVLVYDEGLRTAWYQLKPGMHINADPNDQVNDFNTAIIVTRGTFHGKLDGQARTFEEGETVLVPEGMTHEFFAQENDYGEFIIVMWGDNA